MHFLTDMPLNSSHRAELDTVFKEFCGFNTTDRKTVADYAQYILTNTPDIKNQKISVQGITISK